MNVLELDVMSRLGDYLCDSGVIPFQKAATEPARPPTKPSSKSLSPLIPPLHSIHPNNWIPFKLGSDERMSILARVVADDHA